MSQWRFKADFTFENSSLSQARKAVREAILDCFSDEPDSSELDKRVLDFCKTWEPSGYFNLDEVK